jgi:hypothetical protein
MHADGPAMDRCAHGMDVSWCYLCRIDTFGVEPQVLWGILDDELADERRDPGPMVPELEGYLRFLCDELDLRFDPTFTQGEAARVIPSLLTDPANESQERTLAALGEEIADGAAVPTYRDARSKIRRLIALRGLRTA